MPHSHPRRQRRRPRLTREGAHVVSRVRRQQENGLTGMGALPERRLDGRNQGKCVILRSPGQAWSPGCTGVSSPQNQLGTHCPLSREHPSCPPTPLLRWQLGLLWGLVIRSDWSLSTRREADRPSAQ